MLRHRVTNSIVKRLVESCLTKGKQAGCWPTAGRTRRIHHRRRVWFIGDKAAAAKRTRQSVTIFDGDAAPLLVDLRTDYGSHGTKHRRRRSSTTNDAVLQTRPTDRQANLSLCLSFVDADCDLRSSHRAVWYKTEFSATTTGFATGNCRLDYTACESPTLVASMSQCRLPVGDTN